MQYSHMEDATDMNNLRNTELRERMNSAVQYSHTADETYKQPQGHIVQ